MRIFLLSVLLCSLTFATSAASEDKKQVGKAVVEERLKTFLLQTRAKGVMYQVQPFMESCNIDDAAHRLTLVASPSFASQNFTRESVRFYYKRLSKSLPKPYDRYDLSIQSCGMPIEQLIAGSKDDNLPEAWGKIDYDGAPWVMNESLPFFVSHGLFDRHIALWQSHGIYYDASKNHWKWQRPNLFCTTEDLFTQTIVVPYLIPMLENAGAVVFTPRERDWQKNETIVDNDGRNGYVEENGHEKWATATDKGFAFHRGTYQDGENPFTQGTARIVRSTRKKNESWASYQPSLAQSGRYAVYVSYQTVAGSVSDAQYIVVHKGERTIFRVNQRMGGGTWVYLGTFDFGGGSSADNRVIVTNSSSERGFVTTDAVRFGGGMGNIARGGAVSGMPRCLEGARYSAQWAGAPYDVYGGKGGSDDYSDDINVRSNMVNWLAGGSPYVPSLPGKGVPFELSLAVHSDAGCHKNENDAIYGSLAICTTSFNDGLLNSGVSRHVSRDFADALLTGLQRDLSAQFGKWARRDIYDRNYSETRKPEVPSAIIETMSHQSFADMRRGLDPNFRFAMARSLYKTILRFVNDNHSQHSVVQPLPVDNFRITHTSDGHLVLSWLPVKDKLEPTAIPTAYNVYVAEDNHGFDNGRVVNTASYTFEPRPGVVYKFRVTAVNRGGESFPSETLAAYVSPSPRAKDVLVVNGFKRLSSPDVVDDGANQGFNLNSDIGVTLGITAGWSGAQTCFDRTTAGREGPGTLGYCGNELAGSFIMGLQQNETICHVEDIAKAGDYNVVGCSLEAYENGLVDDARYVVVDVVFGLQKDDGHSLVRYKTFSSLMQQRLRRYMSRGGRLLVSGAYLGSDMLADGERGFMAQVLNVDFCGVNNQVADNIVNGLGTSFDVIRRYNDRHYAAPHVDVLRPSSDKAFCAMQYADGTSAAVAFDGATSKSFVMGFPYECINNIRSRQQVMKAVMTFLVK